MIFALFSPKET